MIPIRSRRALLLFSSLAIPVLSTAQTEGLRVGIAKADITPVQPCMLGGYASRTNLSTGVHDPLSARAMVFEHDGHRLALVSVDILGFYNETAEPLRNAIIDACGLQPAQLMLAAIHTHAAPIPVLAAGKFHPNNVDYTKTLKDRLVKVTKDAIGGLRPARIGIGVGASPVGVNRRERATDKNGQPLIRLGRNPPGITDHDVQVLQVRERDTDQIAGTLFAYATHGTSLGGKNLVVSGDVLGLAEQFVEKYLGNGIVAPAFAGASGDIDPWFRVLPEIKTADNWIPEPVLLGTFLGEEAIHTSEGIRDFSPNGPVASLLKTVQLPAKADPQNPGQTNSPPLPFAITAARVGDVALIGLGGEVFNEIGRAIKDLSPFPRTIIITHCNGAAGYLVPARAYAEGGYEVKTTHFSPDAAELAIKEVAALLRQLKGD